MATIKRTYITVLIVLGLAMASCDNTFNFSDPDPDLFMVEVTAGIYSSPDPALTLPDFGYADISSLLRWVDRTETTLIMRRAGTLQQPPSKTVSTGEVAMWTIEYIRTGNYPSNFSFPRLRGSDPNAPARLSSKQIAECADLYKKWWQNWLQPTAVDSLNRVIVPIAVDPLEGSPYTW